LGDKTLLSLADTAGQSNDVVLSEKERTFVKGALFDIDVLVKTQRHTEDDYELEQLLSLQQKLNIAVAPHKSLAPDILTTIFTELALISSERPNRYGLEDPHFNDEWDSRPLLEIIRWRHYEPSTIRQVCARWRHLVIHQTALWSNMRIPFLSDWGQLERDIGNPSWATVASKALYILPKNTALSLELMIRRDVHDIFSTLLLPCATYLSSLSIDAGYLTFQSILKIKRVQFPLLTNVRLICDDSSVVPNEESSNLPNGNTSNILECAPNIRVLTVLASLASMRKMFIDSVNLQHLTALDLRDGLSLEEIFPILTQCTNLSRLRTFLQIEHKSSHPIIELPNLQELTVLSLGGTQDSVFDYLRVPNLIALKAWCEHTPSLDHMISMITRSNCKLLQFEDQWSASLFNTPPRLDQYTKLMDKMPLLQKLQTGVDFNAEVLQAIGTGTFLPYLSSLKCALYVTGSDILEALESGLRMRDSSVPPLAPCHIICLSMLEMSTPEDNQALRERRKEFMTTYGVDVEVHSRIALGFADLDDDSGEAPDSLNFNLGFNGSDDDL
jgi:hypothetical protein